MPKDIVLILFGGSGSEIEVCKSLDRQYISAEIDEKYYQKMIKKILKIFGGNPMRKTLDSYKSLDQYM